MDSLSIITVPYIQDEHFYLSSIEMLLDAQRRYSLAYQPWPEYSYSPDVHFSIAYNKSALYLKFFVSEIEATAVETNTNGKVWKDSCVEFFIAFDDKGYYNLECNAAGVALLGFGKNKKNRLLIPDSFIDKYLFTSVMRNAFNGKVNWELLIEIPWNLFTYHSLSVKGKKYKANFFKCGDGLQQPHFLSWSNIISDEPNFHLPQYFGTLYFE